MYLPLADLIIMELNMCSKFVKCLSLDQVFFAIWCISVVWFMALVLFKREVHNWFRMPCDLSCAHVLHIWAQGQQEILSFNPSRVVYFVRKLKVRLTQSYLMFRSWTTSLLINFHVNV